MSNSDDRDAGVAAASNSVSSPKLTIGKILDLVFERSRRADRFDFDLLTAHSPFAVKNPLVGL